MRFPRFLPYICTVATVLVLLAVLLFFKHRGQFASGNRPKVSSAKDGKLVSAINDVDLPQIEANNLTKRGGSASSNGVAHQKRLHRAMSGGNPPNDSSSTPEVPIWFPDGTLVPQPKQLTLEDDVALAKRFIEFYDKDPSTIGVVDHGGGKFFPLNPNTVYVTRKMDVNQEGQLYLVGQSSFGTVDVPEDAPIPAGVRVIELSPQGDSIREYIASGDWREFLLEQGVDPAQLEDILAELEMVGDFTEGTNNTVLGAINDEGIADMGAYPNQTDEFSDNNTTDVVGAKSSDQSARADREQRLRSLMRQLELEDEAYRPEREDAETAERQDRPPVREAPEKPIESLKGSSEVGIDSEPEGESGEYTLRPD